MAATTGYPGFLAAAARTRATRQQRGPQGQQQGPGWAQGGVNNRGKSGGNAATTAARTMARDTWLDEGDPAVMLGYCGDGGGGVTAKVVARARAAWQQQPCSVTAATATRTPARATAMIMGNAVATMATSTYSPSSILSLCLYLFFWLGSQGSLGLIFCLIHKRHVMHGTPVHVNWLC